MAAAAARFGTVQRRVLVVEDDAGVCEVIADALALHAVEAHCVRTDREAYDALLSHWDAVVLDVNLGAGTTGFDIARFARAMRPDFPVVFVSGQTTQASFKAHGVPDAAFVAKPFTAEELVDALEIALATD